ncbi:2-methylcitrate dehydratase [Paracoccidioides brasiliensis Pb18]|uniref:2-methylcitrate dehydratase n=2 Tax=Paracoccidioides brasiliensis TaxID=121759 RepID=C1GCJ6_PARBD|nr:2-methylcitrate dehydratase [Paracoccidioides brasiliensis Pb18]EEH48639.2 2-methylcitrate dehydratase [Paracoccidioides brasiliensis Pb18]ODH45411.1 2-methylcitrate dehydratase [Paracoccidioides brasiliensis]ODH52685.1 2-methylcitrate dehydratase [Paracoccidioides brasiliensis]
MSVARQTLRQLSSRAPRSLPLRQLASSSVAASSLRSTSSKSAFSSKLLQPKSTVSRSAFSTMSALNSAAPAPTEPREYDSEIAAMANYIHNYNINSDLAFDTARWVFLDTLGCGLEALKFKECTKLLGPIVEGTIVPNGCKVPGTPYQLDPVNGAFNIGAMIRWLDYNDCWLAAEWGHPSDNLGGILAVADWISRTNRAGGSLGNGKVLTVRDVLEGMIKAHEIQGVLALENSYNKVGLDHVVLVKVATTAVVSKMLGLNEKQTADAITQAWVDGQSLRTYRHSPNTMSRKSWAAGDACQRAVNLALKVMKGEPGVPTVLSAPVWGFYDVLFNGNKFKFQRPYGSYVMENVLFKVSYPAEFHSQTAIEAAKNINKTLAGMGKSAKDIKDVTIRTHEACVRIIDKQFKPMDNFADRDHCIQYMVATMLVFNRLVATDYTDGSEAATSELVESLRKRIKCVEDPQMTKDYHDPSLRTIPNALTVTLNDGTVLKEVEVAAPLGHRLRREEAKPEILAKYKRHLDAHYDNAKVEELVKLGLDQKTLESTDVDKYVDLYVKKKVDF